MLTKLSLPNPALMFFKGGGDFTCSLLFSEFRLAMELSGFSSAMDPPMALSCFCDQRWRGFMRRHVSGGLAVSSGQPASLSCLAPHVRWAHPNACVDLLGSTLLKRCFVILFQVVDVLRAVASTKIQSFCTQYKTQLSFSSVEGNFFDCEKVVL